jgi:hypothetical protein
MVWTEQGVLDEIATLKAKITVKMNDQQSAIDIFKQFELIKQTYEADGTTPIPIQDKGTSANMSDVRKDEVFDACKTKADLVT